MATGYIWRILTKWLASAPPPSLLMSGIRHELLIAERGRPYIFSPPLSLRSQSGDATSAGCFKYRAITLEGEAIK